MANTIVKVPIPQTGTFTLELYAKGADTLLNSDGADTLTRLTNNKTWATATVTEAVTGVNMARVRNAANDDIGYFFTESMADDTNTYLCVEVDPTTVNTANDRLGFVLSSLVGACANPQAATATTVIIIGADTYQVVHAGLDATGVRTAPTLNKT